MNMDDNNKATGFVDSACACRFCDHKITSECIKSSCSCCKEADHSVVLDGMEGFASTRK